MCVLYCSDQRERAGCDGGFPAAVALDGAAERDGTGAEYASQRHVSQTFIFVFFLNVLADTFTCPSFRATDTSVLNFW